MGYLEGLMSEKEKIVFKTRQHWLTILPKVVVWGVISVAIVAVSIILAAFPLIGWLALVILLALVFPFWRVIVDFLNWWNEQDRQDSNIVLLYLPLKQHYLPWLNNAHRQALITGCRKLYLLCLFHQPSQQC